MWNEEGWSMQCSPVASWWMEKRWSCWACTTICQVWLWQGELFQPTCFSQVSTQSHCFWSPNSSQLDEPLFHPFLTGPVHQVQKDDFQQEQEGVKWCGGWVVLKRRHAEGFEMECESLLHQLLTWFKRWNHLICLLMAFDCEEPPLFPCRIYLSFSPHPAIVLSLRKKIAGAVKTCEADPEHLIRPPSKVKVDPENNLNQWIELAVLSLPNL